MIHMAAYIGTKIVLAEPKEKDGKPGYAVAYEDGYVSWSPKDTFERAHRLVSVMEAGLVHSSFSSALQKRVEPL